MRNIFFLIGVFCLLLPETGKAQVTDKKQDLTIDGEIVTAYIQDNGDTILMADLKGVSVTAVRTFKNKEDERLYWKYRRYALIVYPYAVEAIRIFREVEDVTDNMKKRKKRRHIRRLKRDLKDEFKDPLKELTKLQGMILTKMIERELDIPMYYLLKDLRGGLSATYWSTLGKLYGYDLKEGYIEGNDPILDLVIQDLSLTYGD